MYDNFSNNETNLQSIIKLLNPDDKVMIKSNSDMTYYHEKNSAIIVPPFNSDTNRKIFEKTLFQNHTLLIYGKRGGQNKNIIRKSPTDEILLYDLVTKEWMRLFLFNQIL